MRVTAVKSRRQRFASVSALYTSVAYNVRD